MIRLRKLYTYPERTHSIEFQDGLNFILGERSDDSNKTNGVGKSMSMEFLNYALLRKPQGSRVLKIPKHTLPHDTYVCVDLLIHGEPLSILRSISKPDNPVINYKGGQTTFDTLDSALNYLGDLYYTDQSGINLNPSIRELLNPSLRDERSEFKDIVGYFDTKSRIPADYTPALYMLHFDVALYRQAKDIIKEIEKITTSMRDLYNSLTQNKSRGLPEVRAAVNSMEAELTKLENELEKFKTYESFDSIEEDLVNLDIQIGELKSQQSHLKYKISKIRSLPKAEKIDESDVLFVYEQFKSGLGDQLKKSFEEVNNFKEKVEQFQHHIVNEKLKSEIANHKVVSGKIRALDDKRSEILKLIDRDGVFKDLKQSIAIYHQKSEESSNTRTQLKRYDENSKSKNRLKSQKSNIVTRIDEQITSKETVIKSFNDTIADIHEYIMGNRGCSFDIDTVNKDTYRDVVKFDMTIDYGGSHSVERVKVFIYDLSLLLNEHTSKKHPSFLVHDNIFDVDQDTLLNSLNFLYSLTNTENFQYILTLNTDKLANKEAREILNFDVHDYSRLELTKQNRFIFGEKYSEINNKRT